MLFDTHFFRVLIYFKQPRFPRCSCTAYMCSLSPVNIARYPVVIDVSPSLTSFVQFFPIDLSPRFFLMSLFRVWFFKEIPKTTGFMPVYLVLSLLTGVMVSIPYIITGKMHVFNTISVRIFGITRSLWTSLSLPTVAQVVRILLLISAVRFYLESLIVDPKYLFSSNLFYSILLL